MKRPNCTVSIKADKTNIQREEENKPRDMNQGVKGEAWGEGKMILPQIWSLKHPQVIEWMQNASTQL